MIAAPASAKKTNPTHWITPNGLPTFLTQINWMKFSEGTGLYSLSHNQSLAKNLIHTWTGYITKNRRTRFSEAAGGVRPALPTDSCVDQPCINTSKYDVSTC